MALPLPLVFLLILLQVFPVPAVRPATADHLNIKVFIKKANIRKKNIIFNSLYKFDLTFRRKGVSVAQVLAF